MAKKQLLRPRRCDTIDVLRLEALAYKDTPQCLSRVFETAPPFASPPFFRGEPAQIGNAGVSNAPRR
jgi:hypothetical protein